MSLVVCKLPKAGLGNQLFPLMHAMVFAEINQIPLMVSGYHQYKVGPYIRKEKKKRHYYGYFTFHKNPFKALIDNVKIFFYSCLYDVIYDPMVKIHDEEIFKNKLIIFKNIPEINDYFFQLRSHKDLVKRLLIQSLHPEIRKSYHDLKVYSIGLHVRKGDFKIQNKDEIFVGGHVRVPETYFIDTVKKLREYMKSSDPVAIFTDGYLSDFNELLHLNNYVFIENQADILDLLQLSKCAYIITSPNSTFSYWSSFLSNAWIIQHDHVQHKILNIDLSDYKINHVTNRLNSTN